MEREFEQCERIVVPSAVAQESFAEYGYAGRTVVVQTGVDSEYFSPNPAVTMASTFRVCYVGRLELAKSVGYFLEAWKGLSLACAELVLVGEVKAQMKSLLAKYMDCGVRVVGALPVREVVRCYREAILFVQPSPNEGLAQVLAGGDGFGTAGGGDRQNGCFGMRDQRERGAGGAGARCARASRSDPVVLPASSG